MANRAGASVNYGDVIWMEPWSESKSLLQACVCALLGPILCGPTNCGPPGSCGLGFPRQELWSGLPFPSPGDLPHPGTEHASPESADGFSTTGATWEALRPFSKEERLWKPTEYFVNTSLFSCFFCFFLFNSVILFWQCQWLWNCFHFMAQTLMKWIG